jgi:hypothetical protein
MIAINSYAQSNIVSEFVSEITNQKFYQAYQKFDNSVQSQIPQNQLSAIWQSVIAQNGELDKYEFNCQESKDNFDTYYYTCHFKHQTIDLKLILSREEEKIAGFFFVPVHSCEEQTQYISPSYFDDERFRQKDIKIKSDSILLGATIIHPSKKSDAICILIHGSGPHDRDETIGINKPFKDLAIGLASEGISSIRYDKRTYTHKDGLENITIEEEVTKDVSSIIKYIQQTNDLKNKSIYLIGHSLGGMLAPKVAIQHPEVKGIVYMAANASSLEDLILKQSKYIFNLDGELSEQEKQQIRLLENQIEFLNDSLTASSVSSKLPLGLPSSYWLSLKDYQPTIIANQLTIPMFFLQGERDYQVTVEEMNLWKDVLKEHGNVDFKLYKNLDHLFFEGDGKPNPTEYSNQANIPYYLIQDIGKWIKKKK